MLSRNRLDPVSLFCKISCDIRAAVPCLTEYQDAPECRDSAENENTMEVTETEEEGVTEVSTGMYYKNLLTLWTLNVPLTSLQFLPEKSQINLNQRNIFKYHT